MNSLSPILSTGRRLIVGNGTWLATRISTAGRPAKKRLALMVRMLRIRVQYVAGTYVGADFPSVLCALARAGCAMRVLSVPPKPTCLCTQFESSNGARFGLIKNEFNSAYLSQIDSLKR